MKLLKNRVKRLGLFHVFSQLLFLFFSRMQSKLQSSQSRLANIEANFTTNLSETSPLATFTDINSPAAIDEIKKMSPECIILSGTRILSADFLARIECPIINIHAGITPAYRGVHGGYWALVKQQPEYFGSTIHMVDEGVDTGVVIAHAITTPDSTDNFSTYPLLQTSAALKVLPSVLKDISAGHINGFSPNMPSEIWSHPTIWQYLINFLKHGVK